MSEDAPGEQRVPLIVHIDRFETFYATEYRRCTALAYTLCGSRGLAEKLIAGIELLD